MTNKDSLQTKKILAKKILCKEKDAKKAKKNIPWNSPFLGHFPIKITIFWTFSSGILLFSNISLKNWVSLKYISLKITNFMAYVLQLKFTTLRWRIILWFLLVKISLHFLCFFAKKLNFSLLLCKEWKAQRNPRHNIYLSMYLTAVTAVCIYLVFANAIHQISFPLSGLMPFLIMCHQTSASLFSGYKR